FDAHAYRTEDYEGVRDFARGCIRTYLILKEKGAQWNADPEIKALLAEIAETSGEAQGATFSPQHASDLLSSNFDRTGSAAHGLKYERLDQLTIDILLGVRE
ncbi:MAG: xylose isomerase, partial [Gammaproteobacteria bacterium]